MRNMTVKYCRRVQPEWKKQVHWQQKTQPWTLKINRPSNFYFCLICFLSLQMMQKVEASKIFKDQKDSYPQSVGRLFLDSRLGICWYMHSLPPRLLQTIQVMDQKKHTTFTKVFPLLCTEREQINLKVVQTLGNDKVQVGLTGAFVLWW